VAPAYTIRPAAPVDAGEIFRLIGALAEYEKLEHLLAGSAEALHEHLFGWRPYAEVIVAERDAGLVGYALFFHWYSTFLTAPGLYLEDLFVDPAHRRRGIGGALLAHVARIAVDRQCARLQWTVLDWNEPAIAFYRARGAEVLPDWRVCRVSGEALSRLAAGSRAAGA
jgi:GNAT superfamily N-acetyltransferase